MNVGIQEILITCGFTFLGSVVSFIIGKRKRDAEVDSNVVQNTAKLVEIYEHTIDRIGPKSIELENMYDELTAKYRALKNDYETLRLDMFRVKSMACYDVHCEKRVKIEAVNELIKNSKK